MFRPFLNSTSFSFLSSLGPHSYGLTRPSSLTRSVNVEIRRRNSRCYVPPVEETGWRCTRYTLWSTHISLPRRSPGTTIWYWDLSPKTETEKDRLERIEEWHLIPFCKVFQKVLRLWNFESNRSVTYSIPQRNNLRFMVDTSSFFLTVE